MQRNQSARLVWPPSPGYFRLKLIRKGWAVPACIQYTETLWSAIIDGVHLGPNPDPLIAAGVSRIWHYGVQSDAAEYHWLLAFKAAAASREPDHPCLRPEQPIIVGNLRPLHSASRGLS